MNETISERISARFVFPFRVEAARWCVPFPASGRIFLEAKDWGRLRNGP